VHCGEIQLITLKSFVDFFRLTTGKFNKEIPSIEPTIEGSLAKALSASASAVGVGLQDGVKDAAKQAFWKTAEGENLDVIAEYDQIERFDPQSANGDVAVTGVLTTIVSVDEELTANGFTYKTLQDSSVQNYTDSITLTFAGGIVTVVTSAAHSLSTNLEVTISGATQTDYNGTFSIIVLDDNTFTYELTAGALTNDSGTYDSIYVLLDVESVETGAATNLASGASLVIDVTDINDTAYAGSNGVAGGLDEESQEDFRERDGDVHTLTPGIATIPSVTASAKSIPGNTRVFVVRPIKGVSGGTPGQPGYLPQANETVVYILRDEDPSILPSQELLTQTKNQIINDGQWPSYLPLGNLYVLAPILVPQDFVFALIAPNTITMQNAITDQLVGFFEDNALLAGTIKLSDVTKFIDLIQDPGTGDFLASYTLTTPSADLVADSGEIFTRGTVTF